MNLDDFFGPKPAVVKLEAKDRWEAIDELIAHLVASKKLRAEHKEAIVAAVRKREASMSTGIGYGIGLPHATTNLISELTWMVGWSKNGLEFDALDGQPVDLVLLFLVPQGHLQAHVQLLAEIAKLIHSAEFRAELRRRFM